MTLEMPKNATIASERIHVILNGKPLLPIQVDEMINRVTKEDVLKLHFTLYRWKIDRP